MKHTTMTERTAPLKRGTRVAAVLTATALMMTAAVTGLTLVESRTQATTMAADTALVSTPPVADLAVADVLYSASGLPELPSLAGIPFTTDVSTTPAAPSSTPGNQPATQVTESEDHPSGDHAEQDD